MQRTLLCFILGSLCLSSSAYAAKEILLRHAPAPDAPVIAKVTASEKVILDAAPAPKNAELGWRELPLPTPFEGFVPIAAIGKNFAILEGTPVHYLPTSNSAQITQVAEGDIYEVVRAKEEWATVRFHKEITGYFIDDATEEIALQFGSLNVPLVTAETVPKPEAVSFPAPITRINPDEPIAQIDPDSLPAENVVWKAASPSKPRVPTSTTRETHKPALRSSQSEAGSQAIMVSPAQTQAREAPPELGPAKAPRLLAGILIREINVEGPSYPIRLQSPEGRLIAYVDFSGIFINDLSPYLDQKVYVRGQIHPLPRASSQLVILAESLRLAE